MTRLIFTSAIATLLLSGCDMDNKKTDISTASLPASGISSAQRLGTVDGCTIYGVKAWGWEDFTFVRCPGASPVDSQSSYHSGKTNHYQSVEVTP